MKHLFLYILLIFCSFACDDAKDKLTNPYLTIELEGNVVNVPTEGKQEVVKVLTNLTKWELVPKVSSGYDWCKVTISSSSSDVQFLTIRVDRNEDLDKRNAEFILRGEGVEDVVFNVVQLGSKPAILVDVESKVLNEDAQTFIIKVTANVKYTLQNGQPWLTLNKNSTRGMVESGYQYNVTAYNGLSMRMDTICIESDASNGESIVVKVPVEQRASDVENVILEDVKLQVDGVKMVRGNQYSNSSPEKTIDGDLSTAYSSAKTTEVPNSVVLEYSLAKNTEKIDYIILHQNQKATFRNQLGRGILYYKTESMSDWIECGRFNESEIISSIHVDVVNVLHPTAIRLELERSNNENVSLAEFECYRRGVNYDLKADAAYFNDEVFSQLKPTTTKSDLSKISHPMLQLIAKELLDRTYNREFRVRTYKSCKSPIVAGRELTIGNRSICDNPTGLFFEKGKKYMVFVGSEIGEKSLNLFICNWRTSERESQTLKLKKGLNILDVKVQGTGYIQYWTDTEQSNPDVRIHVCCGNEIGFWDIRAGHKNKDWKRILEIANTCARRLSIDNAMLDVLGQHVQLINTIEAFNSYCPDDIEDAMKMHDELMLIEYTMMGLVKHGALPKNRILGVHSWGGLPNWNGTCANYPGSEEATLKRASFIQSIWVFGHEFGHGNQLTQMKSAGWTEVTNNLFAQQVMYLMDNGSCRLEHTGFRRQGYNTKVVGDRFNAYLNDAIIKGKIYLTQQGGLVDDPEKGQFYEGDPFVSLAPLWQLSLFFMLTKDAPWSKPDFWADVHWAAIQDDSEEKYGVQYGKRYVNFMKRAIDASELDLTKFFEQIGLLREINMRIGDYGGPKYIVITKAMVDEVLAYGRRKQQAPTPVINYISGNSLNAYKKRLPVEGTYNMGVSSGDLFKTVSHSVWKNVVAFETYAKEKMIEVCIVGTGSIDQSSTFVRYPEGATRIEAVSWDGKRTLVYGTR